MDEANEAYEERLEAARTKRHMQEAADRTDAARYRWLRGDGGESSVRWPRWQVQHWAGCWNPVQGTEMDTAVDAAMRHDKDGKPRGQETFEECADRGRPWHRD